MNITGIGTSKAPQTIIKVDKMTLTWAYSLDSNTGVTPSRSHRKNFEVKKKFKRNKGGGVKRDCIIYLV